MFKNIFNTVLLIQLHAEEKKSYTWKSLEISAGIIITFFKGSCNKVVKIVEAYNSSMQSTTTINRSPIGFVSDYLYSKMYSAVQTCTF